MADSFPLETVIRAFILILDHHSVSKAAEVLVEFAGLNGRSPVDQTIRKWAKSGELVGIDWYNFREIADTVRMKVATDEIVRHRPREYQQFVENAKADLDKLQDLVLTQISQVSIGRPSDIKHILEARRELEQDAEWRIEQTEEITQVIGTIIRSCAEFTLDRFPDENVKKALELLLDSVAEEFQRFLAFGGDTDNYEVATGSGSSSRRLQPRDNGREET